jgi:hypothetical protein
LRLDKNPCDSNDRSQQSLKKSENSRETWMPSMSVMFNQAPTQWLNDEPQKPSPDHVKGGIAP